MVVCDKGVKVCGHYRHVPIVKHRMTSCTNITEGTRSNYTYVLLLKNDLMEIKVETEFQLTVLHCHV